MTIIQNDAFKTVHLSFYFIEKIEVDAYAYRFLLARLLTSYTKTYDTKKKLIDTFAKLYGAYITNQVFTIGQYHVLKFTLVCPNPSYIFDESYSDDLVSLVKELFFERPLFKEDMFEEVKRYALQYISTRKDRRFEYAREQFMYYTFKNHPYGAPISGDLQTIQTMSVSELYDYYEQYFLKNNVKIYVSGALDDKFLSKLSSLDIYESKDQIKTLKVPMIKKTLTKHEEVLPMGQAVLFFAYQVPVDRRDDLYIAAQLATIILGGYPESILFKRIREDLMLAYDIESHYEYDKKHMFIYAGVNLEEKQLAYDQIIDLVNNFIFDGTDEAQLGKAKKFLINQVSASLDHQVVYTSKYFLSDVFQINEPLEAFYEKVKEITLADIKKVASMILLTTTYTLSGDVYEI